MRKRNGVNWSTTIQARQRRRDAYDRLKSQLESGVKPSKESPGKTTPLTEKDIKRINREIATLKERS